MLESDIAEDAIRSLIPENTTNDHYTVRILAPFDTTQSATPRNRRQPSAKKSA
jgi:hypothetical protein